MLVLNDTHNHLSLVQAVIPILSVKHQSHDFSSTYLFSTLSISLSVCLAALMIDDDDDDDDTASVVRDLSIEVWQLMSWPRQSLFDLGAGTARYAASCGGEA